MSNEEIIKVQAELITLLEGQVEQLSIMSKIELGDDAIQEIIRLKSLLKNENKENGGNSN